MTIWLLTLLIGLPIVGLVERMRRRNPSRVGSLEWRFIVCIVLASVITPVFIRFDATALYVPALLMLFSSIVGFILSPRGFDLEFIMLLYGILAIAIVAVVLCAVWSLIIYIRRVRK